MPGTFSAATAKAMVDAAVSGATTLEVWTVDYGAKLAEIPITFGSASEALPSVATVTGLPITASASGSGTAGAFRVTAGGSTRWEGTGTDALNTANAIVVIDNLTIASGDGVKLISCGLGFPGSLSAGA